jgi:outer membrane protein
VKFYDRLHLTYLKNKSKQMKKFLTVLALATGLLFAGGASAQVKIGYIRIDDMVSLMPEAGKLDSLLQKYQTDSLNPQYAYIVSEYQRKDSMYRDSVHTPAAVRKQLEPDLQTLIYQIQNWQSIVSQATENKQNELLAPLYRRVYDAVKLVAKEKGYTHVLTKEALLVAPEGDDMLLLVAAKLKITVPKSTTTGGK